LKKIRVGHSPDPDDAFMFYAIAHEKINLKGYDFVNVVEDIESLNKRALSAELEVTAISAAVYPKVADNYRIMSCGASIGRAYGPIIIARQEFSLGELRGKTIAVPGLFTTAYLLLQLYLSEFQAVPMDFDAIPQAVIDGDVDAGLVIHEAQLTYSQKGLVKVVDFGQSWAKDTGLPIPLGLDMVRRNLGEDVTNDIFKILYDSIYYAMDHESEALKYALQFGRNIDKDTCARFVRMYVNQDTVQMGSEGKKALDKMYKLAYERALISSIPPLDIIGLNERMIS